MARQPMSMEAMLDEERREVLALLEGTASRAKSTGARSPSPFGSTRSPVRSMLDFGDEPSPSAQSTGSKHRPAPIRSMLDFDGPPKPIRSMLDPDSPPSTAVKPAYSATTSPLASPRAHPVPQASHHLRSFSDAASKPAEFGPRAIATQSIDPTAGYQFSGIITNHAGQAMPKRVTQGGKRGVMSEIMRGGDVQNLVIPGDRGRHYSVSGASTHSAKSNKSKSPGRSSMRSSSPGTHLLSGRHLSPAGRAVLEESTGMDMQNAYRRLSDANLARSGGSLAVLSQRKRSDDGGSARLVKDYMSPDGEILPEESSDEDASTSDDETTRGRKASRTPDNGSLKSPSVESKKRTSQSLLAAAEEERLQVAATQPQYHYRSLLDDPQITVTNPSGEKSKPTKPGIHPVTSFDVSSGTPGTRTPIDSDTEQDFTDIKRAQKLVISMTPILSSPDAHRAIRIIYRGEYAKVVQDAENENRRLKKYIVASDMSEESTHALEWTVGTVLRDGDTMICLYCIDEETGIVSDNGQVPDEPKAIKEQAAAINAVANFRSSVVGGIPGASSLLPLRSSEPGSKSGSGSGSGAASAPLASPSPSYERTKAEDERERAINDITDRVTRLLRKTRLQVRVVVEVLHCKNPKHLITEVIDLVNPTLVVLGSRGRSALKGVILGSFSNYLVTKSSVPVMVARKRLRKQSKYKRTLVPQVNLLTNPTARSLANAKID
ncbi:hypothetical protein MCOR25_008554 [Pyricularia grisea]|uniref:UspA domain-containing protein n=1 Tax=Pyricularia grisea TaxID=148305 RepID=A0A6P8BK66_PYRGI|nr:uncharacterized protein PgNI_01552 [Pyricularia grisea]KAI6354570.1 hypothetical protein MCOR25_008554 [Pyricularia grisea]TLD17079.1 hypothetical protein PgNI_01552 [Pyricularia grisea]